MSAASTPRALLVALATLAFPLGSLAVAQAPSRSVAVEVVDCGELVSSESLHGAVALELRAADDATREFVSRQQPRVRVRCANGELRIEVFSARGTGPTESVQTGAPGLNRFVAIAIAEELAARAMTSTPTTSDPPEPTEAGAEPADTDEPAEPARRANGHPRWLRLSGGAVYSGRPTRAGASFGLAFEFVFHSLLSADVGLRASSTSFDAAPGRVTAWSGSAAFTLRLGVERDRVARVDVGLGVRLGFQRWSGTPNDSGLFEGRSGLTPWLVTTVNLRGAVWLSRLLRLELALEAGPYLVANQVSVLDGEALAQGRNVYLAGHLALAVQLGRSGGDR